MPSGGPEIMRAWVDAWNRVDLDAFFDLYGDEAVVVTDPSWMEAGPYRGRAAIREWFEGLREAWDQQNEVTLTDVGEAGGRTVLRCRWLVRGRASGIDTELDVTGVSTIEGGRIVHQQFYFDHDEALAALD